MHVVDIRIGQHILEPLEPPLDAEGVSNRVQSGARAPADGVNVGPRMPLVDRDKLSTETEPDDRDVDLILLHSHSVG